MLTASDISVRVGAATLVEEVSLELAPGRIVALCGPSGAGKSTLMRVLSGERRATAGSVLLEGEPLHRLGRRELALRRAVLPQNPRLSFPFRAREVVRMGRLPHRSSRQIDAAVVDTCLAQVGIPHLADRDYTSLSGGEQQRVHLARVLAQLDGGGVGKVLLLDEPTSALDLRHATDVLRLLSLLSRHGTAVGVVLHDLNLAAAFADELVVMHQARVHIAGTPAEALSADVLCDAFGLRAHILDHPDTGRPFVVPAQGDNHGTSPAL